VTFRGTRAEAKKELRRLVRSTDAGEHIEPTRITLTQWIDRWLALLSRLDGAEPGKRKRG
jgi:integrase